MTRLVVILLLAAFAVFAWLSLPKPDGAQAPGAGQQTAFGSGVVQGIDMGAGMVTIKHGPLPALNMMPMTLSYSVRDRNQLAKLQTMQKVEFQVSYDGKAYTITDIK